jgi:hypothetical protein
MIRNPGLVLTEHELSVPLDHGSPGGEAITVFARELADPDGLDKPFLVYLAGRPGVRGAAADAPPRRAGLAGPRAAGVPRADARPARHRTLDARRRASRHDAAAAGGAPDALPRRLDRARRGPGRRADLRRGRRARLEGRDLLAELKLEADAALLAGRARPAQL